MEGILESLEPRSLADQIKSVTEFEQIDKSKDGAMRKTQK